jgi:hypothetical protein
MPPFQPGHPKVGGRKRGTRNKATIERELQEATLLKSGPTEEAFSGDALGFLQLIYRDPDQPRSVRLDAARVAVGFEVPRLQAVAVDARVRDVSSRQLSASEMLEVLANVDSAKSAEPEELAALPPDNGSAS